MRETDPERVREVLDTLYRLESRRILATLIRLLGDIDIAEDALQDAFKAALEQWPAEGIPANPRPWLVSAGRFKAIDRLRRSARFDTSLETLADQLADNAKDPSDLIDESLSDADFSSAGYASCQPESHEYSPSGTICPFSSVAISTSLFAPPGR
jgi:RNA polymerase sigma-70 factor (ECF subfamily)